MHDWGALTCVRFLLLLELTPQHAHSHLGDPPKQRTAAPRAPPSVGAGSTYCGRRALIGLPPVKSAPELPWPTWQAQAHDAVTVALEWLGTTLASRPSQS
jgi:hypothetical protein